MDIELEDEFATAGLHDHHLQRAGVLQDHIPQVVGITQTQMRILRALRHAGERVSV